MTESGFYLMARGWLDHPSFSSREPYSRREAWIWLIEAAAFTERRVGVVGKTVTIARGQLTHSTRFMAGKWGWSEAGVRRFLHRLKTDAMIDAHSDAGQMIVTICNYDKYQTGQVIADADVDAAGDAEATQHRRSTDAKKKEGNKGKEGKKDIVAIATLDDFDAEFAILWADYPEKVGKAPARKKFEIARRKVSLTVILAGITAYIRSKPPDRAWLHLATWLHQQRWTDQHNPQLDLGGAHGQGNRNRQRVDTTRNPFDLDDLGGAPVVGELDRGRGGPVIDHEP